MKILLLGPYREQFTLFLRSFGDGIVSFEDPLSASSIILDGVDFIISYGYRHIIGKDVIRRFPRRIINLYISYLPWNRGADPNLWSFLDNTPKGVTIHYIEAGLDTGDIIAQEEVSFQHDDTLITSYERLAAALETLFRKFWAEIREEKVRSFTQPPGGSSHRLKDRASVKHLLTKGWDTPVLELIGKGSPVRQEA